MALISVHKRDPVAQSAIWGFVVRWIPSIISFSVITGFCRFRTYFLLFGSFAVAPPSVLKSDTSVSFS